MGARRSQRCIVVTLLLTGAGCGGGSSPQAPSPAAPACVPVLLSPDNGAVLDNGRTDFTDPIVWDFDWSDCPRATGYHLIVIGPTGSASIDETTIRESSFRFQACNFVAPAVTSNWSWRVRAGTDGLWGDWSTTRNFSLEPHDTDPSPGSSCR